MTAHARTLAAAIDGDDRALAALVRLHYERVHRFGRRVCRDGADADDAVQEAFVRLSRRPDVIADRGALSWLLTVVRNTCRRMLRPFVRERRALGAPTEHASVAEAVHSPQEALERWELVRVVHQAIASLEPPYRAVIVLRDLEGLSGEETCAALGIELAAMKSRLHRARAMLRAQLTDRVAGAT